MAAAVIGALAITSACGSDDEINAGSDREVSDVTGKVQERIDAAKKAGEFKVILGAHLSQSAADELIAGFTTTTTSTFP